jgi:glycosyltransferase involved in cell wall biosynthesis
VLKILMIETGGWGGMWHYTCCLSNALSEQGMDLSVITTEGFEKPFELKFNIFPFIKKDRTYLTNLFQLYRFIYTLQPSLVHIQSWFSARRDWPHLMIIRIAKIPIVLTAHNLLPHDDVERNLPFMFWAFKKIYKSADSIIVHSGLNKKDLAETFGIPQRKVSVIKHGNYQFFAEKFQMDPSEARKAYLSGKESKRIFLIFGAIRHYKGIDLALHAVSRLSLLDKMHIIVAGKPYGSVLEDLKKISMDLGIGDHVTFLPGYLSHEEVASLHAAAHVCVFPYRGIFQSGSLQTALSFAKPIIATSIGSFPETLNNKNAWLVEPNSSMSLAGAMEKALRMTQEELAAMGKESLRISKEEHDWNKIAAKTGKLYQRLI